MGGEVVLWVSGGIGERGKNTNNHPVRGHRFQLGEGWLAAKTRYAFATLVQDRQEQTQDCPEHAGAVERLQAEREARRAITQGRE